MKKISFVFVAAAILPILFSCKELPAEEGYGYLKLVLDQDMGEEPVFKSGTDDGEEPVFSVTIYNSLDEEVAYYEDYRMFGDEPLVLPAGNFKYRAVASSGEDVAAAFDEPFYSGETEFRIANGKTTDVTIKCSLSNVKVTASFSGEIRELFSQYRLTVSNGKGTLVYDNQADPVTVDKEGYFSATGQLTWSLFLKSNDGKVYDKLCDTYSDVKARQHYNLRFSLGSGTEADGAGAVTVIVNDSMNEVSDSLKLDFTDGTRPGITADFDMSEPLTVVAGDATPRTLELSSADGFKSIEIRYGADELTSMSHGTTYELVNASGEVIDALNADGISVSSVAEGAGHVDMDLTSYVRNLQKGSYFMEFFLVDKNGVFVENTLKFNILPNKDVEMSDVNPWARFAEARAVWYTEIRPESMTFLYRKSSEEEWTEYHGEISVDPKTRAFSAEIRGLDPKTEYVVKAVTAEESDTKELVFKTEQEGTVPNMNFDSWYQDGSVWYPNSDADNFYWDSANGGTSTLKIYPTKPAEPENVYIQGEGKNAARLESMEAALVGLAAGNIYTGKFVKAVISLTNPGAELDWGIPFTSRPLALTGYFKYLPVTVNKGTHNGMSGKTDIGQIQIMLTDWDAPFRINTASGRFVDVGSDPGIIAYGALDLNETDSYQPFEIRLDYRDVSRTPKYIVIVAAASKYGDYFTGGAGSVLYLDEFEFIYDPEMLEN